MQVFERTADDLPPVPPHDGGDDDGEGGDPGPLPPRVGTATVVALVALGIALLLVGAAGGYALHKDERPAAGSVDVGFLQDMRLHHDNAVRLGLLYLAKGKADRPTKLYAIANEVVGEQQFENGIMVQLLTQWGRPTQNETDEVMAWMSMPVAPDKMPGLVSEDTFGEFQAATGAEADRMFADLLIAHHQGGVHMADEAAQHAGTARVRQLAAAMASAQRGEINELQAFATPSS